MNHQFDLKAVTWARAAFEDGFPRGEWRKDRCGRWMAWSQFESHESPYGWSIAELPVAALGGLLDLRSAPEAISYLSLGKLTPRVIAA